MQGSAEVPYPSGAAGDAAVLLDVDVDSGGHVSRAIVTEGAEPFAEQARRAVLEWRFTPARRGGTPVAARIRARVVFHQEPDPGAPGAIVGPAPATQGVATATPAPGGSAVVPEVAQDVEVRGARHEIGETTLSAD